MYRTSMKPLGFLFTTKLHRALCIFYLMLGLSFAVFASTSGSDGDATSEAPESYAAANSPVTYDWNLKQNQQPLLSLPPQINSASELSLTYPMGQLRFPLFQSLKFNDRSGRYAVQVISRNTRRAQITELTRSDVAGRYISENGADLYLTDNKGVKAIRSGDGTEYTFVRFNDGLDRCVRVKTAEGSIITLVYAADNLIHGVVDSVGRAIRFNYESRQMTSVTQTWTANSVSLSKTWPIGRERNQVKLAHASSSRPALAKFAKPVPNNAATPQYTAVMANNDRQLAQIFGGPGAVAAANSYEPPALAHQYPLYRGDLIANDGRLIRGHLSYAMHLYGNAEGTGDSAVYVPAGFTTHSSEPGPTDAAVTFYYPRLGNLTDVTLAVFHVAHFAISYEGGRVRIGDIGGPGGSFAGYKHSHIEFYRGNTGLPPASARERLRIDPARVFNSRS